MFKCYLRFLCSLLLTLITGAHSYAQCGNIGFDLNNNTGWKGYIGDCSTGPNNQMPTLNIATNQTPWTTPQYYFDVNNETPDANRWEIVSSGFDEMVPMIPKVSPWGGPYSCKLGNSNDGGNAERLRFWPYAVTAQNCNLVYQYAVVLENTGNPPHDINEMPAFRVKIMTANTQVINPTCGQHNIYSGQNGVGFQTYQVDATTSVSYRNWSMASVDLTAFIGQNIALEFTTNDCSLSGHFGYAYIDLSCIPLSLNTNYCTGSPTAVVTAPEGYNGYAWTANNPVTYPMNSSNNFAAGQVFSSNNQITINANDVATTYSVNMIPYQGSACAVAMSYVFNPVPTLDAGFTYSIGCGNETSQFTDTSLVLNNGQPINIWHWDFGDGTSDTAQHPIHICPFLDHDTTYQVTLIIRSDSSCADTITQSVYVPSGLEIDTLNIQNITCHGLNNGIAAFLVHGENANTLSTWHVPSPPGDVNQAIGLPPNTAAFPDYWFVVTNSNNSCRDSVSFHITEPAELHVTVNDAYILCHQNNASLTATPTGGTAPYHYFWNIGQNTAVASGLAAGTYFVSVVDTQGCIATDSATLVDGSLVRWEIKKKNITCYGGNDGNIGIKFWGGIAPYTSAWLFSNNSTAIGTSDTAYFDLLPSGITQVVVHNQNNCIDDTLQIQLSQPDSFQVKHISTPSSCELAMNGSLKITVVGNNQPYTYQWSNTPLNQAYLTQVYAGNYSVLITDSKGCSTTRSLTIASDSLFQVDAKEDFFYDPNLEENIVYASTNKPGNYSYSWSPTEHLFDPLKKESKLKELFFIEKLRVDVMDEWGCTNFDSVTVFVPPSIYIPNVFTPNGDGDNDAFKIAYEEFKLSQFQFSVFDRWGNVLFQTGDPHFTWSGDGIPSGVYNYQMKYIWDETKKSSNSGTITLIR